ncbi:Gamma-COP [Intoshia linei]|uniref:Coatomer subunit gamma n=1 Tax=Intoshia linei TaxID=1819745 RepID=A0A177AVB7_9BILA|nr:Gamma-COP [Intoshia linei]
MIHTHSKQDALNDSLIKSTVLQELKAFSASNPNIRENRRILSRFMTLIGLGTPLTTREATDAFFAITKLFQCDDFILRKLVYVAIKELSKIANDVIIVTSSITRDMNGTDDEIKASAIRTLSRIIDISMIQSVDRYLKQSIVSNVPHVASAALVSSLNIGGSEIARRWINEAQEAITNSGNMVPFHAIGFMYAARKNDKLAIQKILQKYKGTLRSPIALCYLIRVAYSTILPNEPEKNHIATNFIESCLKSFHDMVSYEAAMTMIKIPGIERKQMARSILVFQQFLSSSHVIQRYAVVSALNKIAETSPVIVAVCNVDLENLISDKNRSIATLAITTLLKTGTEASVDRLMKQIISFLSELSDEFKVVLVKSIRTLFTKFPRKHKILMHHLSYLLREQGGVFFKNALVETLMSLVSFDGSTKDIALSHLSEFIEDCEHTNLLIRILSLIGCEGPKSSEPYKYIRYVYNRILLENSPIRRVVTHVLAKFGASCDYLRASVITLLERCLLDRDDQVRDRATLYVKILKTNDKNLYDKFIFITIQKNLPIIELELCNYLKSETEEPYIMSNVYEEIEPAHSLAKKPAIEILPSKEKNNNFYMEKLLKQHFILKCGQFFKTCSQLELTEPETEYIVSCYKHIFEKCIILEFRIFNTIDVDLCSVSVVISNNSDESICSNKCLAIESNKDESLYIVVPLVDFNSTTTVTFDVNLQFTLDPDCDGEYEEYPLESVSFSVEDYMKGGNVDGDFETVWESLKFEASETFDLSSLNNVSKTIETTLIFFPMKVVDNSNVIQDENSKSHNLKLLGFFHPKATAAISAQYNFDDDNISLELTVRSESEHICQLLCNVIC